MDINYKQDQFELFPGATPNSSGPQPQPRWMFSSVTLSGENIIVLTIFVFLVIIVSFSFGVERGKGIVARADSQAKKVVAASSSTESRTAVRQNAVAGSGAQKAIPPVKKVILDQGVTVAGSGKAASNSLAKNSPLVSVKEEPVGFYTVQVASFKKQESADKEVHGLKKKGYEAFVVAKGEHLILCAGRFSDRSEAKVFSEKLKSKYKDCLVRRL